MVNQAKYHLSQDNSLTRQIVSLLCNSPINIANIVKRIADIYDLDIITQPSHHLVVPSTLNLSCKSCGNNNDKFFKEDRHGNFICLGESNQGCGEIVDTNNSIDEGPAYRNFADTADRNNHGPPPSALFSTGYNMGTMIKTRSFNPYCLSWSSGGKEVDFSLRSKDGETREEYKDDQKRQAFAMMNEVSLKLNIHYQVKYRAFELFTIIRNNVSRLHHYDITLAAVLVMAQIEFMDQQDITNREISECYHCGCTFQSRFELDRHVKSHTPSPSISTSSCPEVHTFGHREMVDFLKSLSSTVHPHIQGLMYGFRSNKVAGITLGKVFLATRPSQFIKYCDGDEAAATILDTWVQEYKKNRCKEKATQQEKAKKRSWQVQSNCYRDRLGLKREKIM